MCEKGVQWQHAGFALPMDLGETHMSPDVISFSAAMSACEKGKQIDKVSTSLLACMQLVINKRVSQ